MSNNAANEWHLRDLDFMTKRAEEYWGMSRVDFLAQTECGSLYYQVQRGWRLLDKISGGRCCPKAEQVPCYCEVFYSCPDHGTNCKGSHD